MKTIFFNIFTGSTLLASIFTITSKNPVISVLFLIATFVLAACYLMFIGVNFIGISYIIVYVGAIAILFLFIIMMINIRITDILETGTQYTKNLPLGLAIVCLFVFIFVTIIPYIYNENLFNLVFIFDNFVQSTANNSFNYSVDTLTTNILQIDSVSFTLYVYGAVLLILCSLILLLAMFSAIIISGNNPVK